MVPEAHDPWEAILDLWLYGGAPIAGGHHDGGVPLGPPAGQDDGHSSRVQVLQRTLQLS